MSLPVLMETEFGRHKRRPDGGAQNLLIGREERRFIAGAINEMPLVGFHGTALKIGRIPCFSGGG